MGIFEKLKNTFFEEEYVEVEEKPKKKKEPEKPKENLFKKVENKRPTVERIKPTKKEEIEDEDTVDLDWEIPPKEEVKKEKIHVEEIDPVIEKDVDKPSFGYFDDVDFLDFTNEPYKEEKHPPKEEKVEHHEEVEVKEETKTSSKIYDNPSYKSSDSAYSNAYSKESKTGFKPTPIISPIYGILDKNYTKDEVIDKKENKPSSYVSRKHVDLDSVREKAFGSLAGDFGLTSTQESIQDEENQEEKDLEIEDNLLYDMTEEETVPSVDKVTLQDAEEYFQDLGLEYNIDYKDAKLERATGRRVSRPPKDIEMEEVVEEKPKEESKEEEENVENSSLEDNLFDLIDSMYEEKEG